MKLAVLNNQHYATQAAIEELAESSLSDQQLVHCIADGKVYMYFVNANGGNFQPTDHSGSTGWWVLDKSLNLANLVYLVANDYDFEENDATDVTTIVDLEIAYLKGKFKNHGKIDTFRDSLDYEFNIEQSGNWEGLTEQEQEILSKYFVVDKTYRDQVYNDAEQKEYAEEVARITNEDTYQQQLSEIADKMVASDAGDVDTDVLRSQTITITPPTITSDQTCYQPDDWDIADVWRISANNRHIDLKGIKAGKAGQRVTVYNVGSYRIRVWNNSGSADSEDRILMIPRKFYIHPNGSFDMYYDGISKRWRITNISSCGGGEDDND